MQLHHLSRVWSTVGVLRGVGSGVPSRTHDTSVFSWRQDDCFPSLLGLRMYDTLGWHHSGATWWRHEDGNQRKTPAEGYFAKRDRAGS